MAIQVEKFPDKKILLTTFQEPLDIRVDPEQALQEAASFSQAVDGSFIRILDFSNVNMNFGDMVVGMSFEKGREGGAYDPNVRTIFIGSGPMVEMGVTSLTSQEQFKGVTVLGLFGTREEALDCARTHSS